MTPQHVAAGMLTVAGAFAAGVLSAPSPPPPPPPPPPPTPVVPQLAVDGFGVAPPAALAQLRYCRKPCLQP